MSRSVVIVTHADHPEAEDEAFSRDDFLVVELRRRKVKVESIPWDDPEVNWGSFDLVIIRSTWDYHLRPKEFIQWFTKMAHEEVKLENPVNICKWNMNKKYLKELEAKGVELIPTEFVTDTETSLEQVMKNRGWNTAVIKPFIGGNAFKLYKVPSPAGAEHFQEIFEAMIREQEGAMVQPFMESILTSGEWSLVFFDGHFSHAANKFPDKGFKVQDQKPDEMAWTEDPPKAVLRAAVKALHHLPKAPLYVRVDVMIDENTGEVILSELELIEPSLYLGHCKPGIGRFADAIMKRLQ